MKQMKKVKKRIEKWKFLNLNLIMLKKLYMNWQKF